MFCGWGHRRGCQCLTCRMVFGMSRKAAYRLALKLSKAVQQTSEDDMLKKPNPGQMYGVADVPFDDEDFRAKYPTLWEYLFTQRWQDGSIRTTSTISLFATDGALKVVINDRDNNRSAFFNARTLTEALDSMESGLCNDTADWKTRSNGQAKGFATPF